MYGSSSSLVSKLVVSVAEWYRQLASIQCCVGSSPIRHWLLELVGVVLTWYSLVAMLRASVLNVRRWQSWSNATGCKPVLSCALVRIQPFSYACSWYSD